MYSTPVHRGYAMVVAKVLKGVLKIRYLVLGGALGGGVTLNKVSFILLSWVCVFFFFNSNFKHWELELILWNEKKT